MLSCDHAGFGSVYLPKPPVLAIAECDEETVEIVRDKNGIFVRKGNENLTSIPFPETIKEVRANPNSEK